MSGTMRAGMAALMLACIGLVFLPSAGAEAQTAAAAKVQLAQAVSPDNQTPRRRPSARLRVVPYNNPDDVYPRYNPGPGAVRECSVAYVQEHRPSGTVIAPHMHCYWRRG